MALYADVWRGLMVEIHAADCKDVERARAKGLKCGTVEGEHSDDAICRHIMTTIADGINLDRPCYRVMPCVWVRLLR